MSEEKKYDRNYREPSAKLTLKTGVKRASQPGTKGAHCTFSLTWGFQRSPLYGPEIFGKQKGAVNQAAPFIISRLLYSTRAE